MTPAEILAAPLSRPHAILGDDFTTGFRKLMREWHPDHNSSPQAGEIAAKLNLLLQSAKRLEENGGYHQRLVLNESRGEIYHYSSEVSTDTGPLFICDKHLIWRTERSNDDLCRQWLETVRSFDYPNDKIREEFQRYVPRNSHTIGRGEYAYTVVSKSKEVIRLADILAKKGPIEPVHVAWILSSMYNFACWLQSQGISHYGFTLENYFVEPDTHVGALLGGWYFSARKGEKPLAASGEVRSLFTDLKSQQADHVHLTLIKRAGRRMLGHNSISTLLMDKSVPQAMRSWLCSPGGASAPRDYGAWQDVIPAAFGGRRFTKYDLTAADVYGDT